MTDFNTADLDQVQQEDDYVQPTIDPIPVCLDEAVRTKELGTVLGPCKNYIIEAAGLPIPILQRNERRARATIMVQNGDICIGATPGETTSGMGGEPVGAIISGSLAVPYHTQVQSDIWASGVFVDVTGTAIVLGPSTDAVLISVVEEYWTR